MAYSFTTFRSLKSFPLYRSILGYLGKSVFGSPCCETVINSQLDHCSAGRFGKIEI